MSIETLFPIPLQIFGGWITLIDPSSVPPGMSPALGDVEFIPGGVRARAGLLSVFPSLAGNPAVNGLKSYITTNLTQRLLVFDALGNLYKEISPGVLSLVSAGLLAPGFMASTTLFGREYIALSDSQLGQDIPSQFDDTYLDRVSQVGPGEGPSLADATDAGSISPGVHQCSVVFVTRQGYWTQPSPPVSWTAAGGKKVSITNIPTGPSNVVQRLLAFTAAGGANFYQVPSTMTIADNTTTTLEVDFDDTILLSGVGMDYLFGLIELPEQLGVIGYVERLFWWGERSNMSSWRNLTFDGGFDLSGDGRPLGWQQDPVNGAGGSQESNNVVWGSAYRITGNGTAFTRGLITQSAVTDAAGNPLLVANTQYSVRARVQRSANLNVGTLRINCYSPTHGSIGTGMAVTAQQATTAYVEYISQLIPSVTTIPSDLVLRVYADGTPGPSGESFLVDNIEIFLTNAAENGSLVRGSLTESPESYDGVTGFLLVAQNNGQAIRSAFCLNNYLYFVKERSLHVTATDGVSEPSLWDIEEISAAVGTPSAHGVGVGESWVVIAGRSGLYYFDGGELVKLSQEIQPTWDAINWAYGSRLWVQIDTQHRRILIGVPMGSSTVPNQILQMDYAEGFGDPIAAAAIGASPSHARKWAPWIIAANSATLAERSTGIAQVFLGNSTGTGKIYTPVEGQYSDDGAAINSYYQTAFLSRTGATGRDLFGYLTSFVQGAGNFALTAFTPGGAAMISLGSWALMNREGEDLELISNVLAERISYQFGTNAVGAWFSLTRFVPWAKPDPWAFVRGHN
jgi:hypothetical protein